MSLSYATSLRASWQLTLLLLVASHIVPCAHATVSLFEDDQGIWLDDIAIHFEQQDRNYWLSDHAMHSLSRLESRSTETSKEDDFWTVSSVFRADVVSTLAASGEFTVDAHPIETSRDGPYLADAEVFEVGSYMGSTTGYLARHVARVHAVDIVGKLLTFNAYANRNAENVSYYQIDPRDLMGLMTPFERLPWEQLRQAQMLVSNVDTAAQERAAAEAYISGKLIPAPGHFDHVSVTIIDGSHDFDSVVRDVVVTVAFLPKVRFVVFDDVAAEPGVGSAVEHVVARGLLEKCAPVGRGARGEAWGFSNRWFTGSEGLVTGVRRTGGCGRLGERQVALEGVVPQEL